MHPQHSRLHGNLFKGDHALHSGHGGHSGFIGPALSGEPAVSLLRRSVDTSSNSCEEGDTSARCEKPTSSNTLAIALGAIIPICAAIIVLYILHRRNIRRRRIEDENDRHKSLDFGMGESHSSKAGKKEAASPEMSINEAAEIIRRNRGMSLDMGSPYLLPATLQSSRESLQSMSRTAHDVGDPYRPVAFVRGGDNTSLHSKPGALDTGSMRTTSTTPSDMNAHLLKHAQPVARSSPVRCLSPTSTSRKSPPPPRNDSRGPPASPPSPYPQLPADAMVNDGGLAVPSSDASQRDSYFDNHARDMRKSNAYLAAFLRPAGASPRPEAMGSNAHLYPEEHLAADENKQGMASEAPLPVPPKSALRKVPALSLAVDQTLFEQAADDRHGSNGNGHPLGPANSSLPLLQLSDLSTDLPGCQPPLLHEQMHIGPQVTVSSAPDRESYVRRSVDGQDQYLLAGPEPNLLGYNSNRVSMGFRPLPPEDPTDNPEQRANRIRSFYKEYFDEANRGHNMPYLEQPNPYQDYSQHHEGAYPLPRAPFAEPVTRRAMTPPPRTASRPPGMPGHAHGGSTSYGMARPRAASTASGRTGGHRHPPAQPLPPPAPLLTLPTPHRLKEDSHIYAPLDFAPPTSFRDRQAGRPDSPLGAPRPYSPAVRAHVPLASPFDDLNVIPSPHVLRKSSTFTALDFAPPPRFRGADTASDAGSIRSNRSGISAVQLHTIRAGAHRVSRIPKDLSGTKNEMDRQLRPTWDMRGEPAGADGMVGHR